MNRDLVVLGVSVLLWGLLFLYLLRIEKQIKESEKR
jgi:hypothetical protein